MEVCLSIIIFYFIILYSMYDVGFEFYFKYYLDLKQFL